MDIEANAATIHDATQLVISTSGAAATSEGASLAAANSGQLRERRPPQTARKTIPTEIEKQAKGQSRIWAYFARRREQTRKDYCVLLAWQVGSETFMVDVPVADPDNEEAVFADINAQYYTHRGRWRKHFGLCGVEGVERVELRLGGLIAQNVLVGKASPENKPDREDLQASMDKYEAMIDRIDFCCCPPNDEAVEPGWVRASDCPVDYGDPCDGPECPYEKLEYFGCRKRNLEGEWDEFRLQCFHRPALAEQQKSLNLEAEDSLILRYELGLPPQPLLRSWLSVLTWPPVKSGAGAMDSNRATKNSPGY
ncbi:hypothetical protein LTR06_009366 [Exophiala xenobiotica]|nr:hypothetical protein LTR06_009366 [Exophiala xenobiotica]